MSYLQFELDVQAKAATIATAAKLPRQWVLAGLVDMWAHCFRERTDRVSSILLLGFFSEPIGEVLAAFGLLEQIDETTWRVRGTDRYTSLTEKRRRAGQKGGQKTQSERSKIDGIDNDSNDERQANQANGTFAQASDKQTGSKEPFAQASAQAKGVANAVSAKQNQALYPRSEKSSPSGKKTSRKSVSSARAHERRPPPDGGGASAPVEPGGNESVEAAKPVAQPDPPPKPKHPPPPEPPVYGSPEYLAAERREDVVLLAWACADGETEPERVERLRPNAERFQAALRAQRVADEAAYQASLAVAAGAP